MKVLLFNPRSNFYKPRIPNSILQVAASIEGLFDYVIVDGNLENDPWSVIESHLKKGDITVSGDQQPAGGQFWDSPHRDAIHPPQPGRCVALCHRRAYRIVGLMLVIYRLRRQQIDAGDSK